MPHTSSGWRNAADRHVESSTPAASGCQNPFRVALKPGQPAVRKGFKWPGKKIWLHWNPWWNSFSSAEPGCHSQQLQSCCLYGIVFLLKSVDLEWEEAVSPGIDYITKSRPREFISSKPLPLLISKKTSKHSFLMSRKRGLFSSKKPSTWIQFASQT